jgi:hypothetical protein
MDTAEPMMAMIHPADRTHTVTIEDVVAFDPADNDVVMLNGGLD